MRSRDITEVTFEIFNFKCFDETGSGSILLLPINFIIGRNNSGKSAIVDFLEAFLAKSRVFDALKHSRAGKYPEYDLTLTLQEADLRPVFPSNVHGGILKENHWKVGSKFAGHWYKVRMNHNQTRIETSIEPAQHYPMAINDKVREELAPTFRSAIPTYKLVRVAAERDVRPEQMSEDTLIMPNGNGLTGAIARQINHNSLDRTVVEEQILSDLNVIYQGDADFLEILTRIDNESSWEIYLREKEKGDIRLSESGSGLKTVLLICALIRLTPTADWVSSIFAIDEPENNLHPALFRRLLEYLAIARSRLNFTLIITTHSPIGIDWAARRENSQVIHIRHDGARARARFRGQRVSRV